MASMFSFNILIIWSGFRSCKFGRTTSYVR